MYDGVHFDKELMFTASTKTQYARPDAHIATIKLLRYISDKYMKDFQLTDEGNYWEPGNKNILIDQFKKYNFYLDPVCDILSNTPGIPGESPETLSDRAVEINPGYTIYYKLFIDQIQPSFETIIFLAKMAADFFALQAFR